MMIRICAMAMILWLGSCANQPARQPNRNGSVSEASSLSTKQLAKNSIATSNRVPARSKQDSTIETSRQNAITQAVQKVSPAVVSITVTEVVKGRRPVFDEFFRRFYIPTERKFSSIGSGFIISKDGMIVTNEHVADANAKKIMVSMTDGSQYKAEVVGADELTDITLLKINADHELPYIKFGNSDEVMVGEWALAIGNPFGLFKAAKPSVTVGVVSALNRDFRPNPDNPRIYLDMIQTDAAINSGNSGGPLVNSQGKVIGMNTFIYTGGTSGGFVGLGFAIPSNRVQKIVQQLASTGEVKKGYDLGIETTPMTYKLAPNNRFVGLFVSSVNRDGPAFKSGIMPGDIIVKIGKTRVQSPLHAQALLREYSVGDTLRIELLRNDRPYEAKIKLRPKVSSE